ncbi:MAG: flagellar biosynthetic protein FliR [Alphaproteobacteria bacterium]|nr:MAG: flagellar biosynthetic protein FliR [Alphaproteobacteria bacterium]
MIELDLLTKDVNAFPGLNLNNIVTVLPLFFLATVRVGSFVISSPLFGMRGVPTPIRVVISFILGLAVVSFTGLPSEDLLSSINFIFIVLVEIAVGLTAGLIVTIWFSSVALAGEKMATSAGLGYAAQIDPQAGGQTPVVSVILNLFLIVLFVSLDGHLLMLRVFFESFSILPIGSMPPPMVLIGAGIKAAGSMFVAASLIMLPVVGIILMINVSAGIMTRSAPQLNLFSFVFPVTILGAFIILYFSTGTMALAFSDLIFSSIEALEDLMLGISDG